jgi:hypothetical protein
MRYVAIRSEGGLIPYDLLDKIASEDAAGQKPGDFGLPKGRRLTDEISRVWADAQSLWSNFKRRRESLGDRDPYGTSITRSWIGSLLGDVDMLGFDLKLQGSAVVVNNSTYAISHRSGEGEDAIPVHIEGLKIDLDRRLHTKLRTSPQAMVQDFLNNNEPTVWGIVTNGSSLRILRNSSRTSRPTYLEFDLENILEGNRFNEFGLFYRVCHRSRFPLPGRDLSECLLEKYYLDSIEQGLRVRDRLREGVEETLKILGTAFLQHPGNEGLREKVLSGKLTAIQFHRQLLLLVYRLLFLMVAEERGLIVSVGENAEPNQRIYDEWYSITRLRNRAGQIIDTSPFGDVWQGLLQTFSLFEYGLDTNPLGIPPLNGDLFHQERAVPDLKGTELYNHELLRSIRHLSLFKDGSVQQRVNYSALDVEELGSVYESLLDYQPVIQPSDKGLLFELRTGTERKSTGSYYTRPELVHELVETALVPVMATRIAEVEKASEGKSLLDEQKAKIAAILNLTVCDPACGSGHFLLAAARRLGKELARIKTGEDEPKPEDFHLAVREVITHCVYGVDLNPLAVDLCKLALWLEGHWSGKPLSFLDHRVRCGNSLIGVLDPKILEDGIPDDAFTAVTGDDKKVSAFFKKRNKEERTSRQRGFSFEAEDRTSEHAATNRELQELSENTAADVRKKVQLYTSWRSGMQHSHDEAVADLWTAQFFLPLTNSTDPVICTTKEFLEFAVDKRKKPQQIAAAQEMAQHVRFFHWHLEFPEVFDKGGFDVLLGNPPWERIKIQEQEFFAGRAAWISHAPNAAARERLIEELKTGDELQRGLFEEFKLARAAAENSSVFARGSGRYPLSGRGDVNTYALFAELFTNLTGGTSRAGVILPTGIATDATTAPYFASLIQSGRLARFTSFENEAFIFPSIHHSFRFCLMVLSSPQLIAPEFCFFLRSIEQMYQPERLFSLSAAEIASINPNTHTAPVFRSGMDAKLTAKIYSQAPVLVNEQKGEAVNPWNVSFHTRIWHMAEDSQWFRTARQLAEGGFKRADANWQIEGGAVPEVYVPLYEAKMIHQFDHRWSTYEENETRDVTIAEKSNPAFEVTPRYWVPSLEVRSRLDATGWKRAWLLGWRDITSGHVLRTIIADIIPATASGNKFLLMFPGASPQACAALLGCLNSLACDYVARQKLGGNSLTLFIMKQLPVLPPSTYSDADLKVISNDVLELVYTSHSMAPLARDLGYNGSPFLWDEARRSQIRAELDAYYAHLYGLTRDELRYILDPKEIFGEAFPSETFRVLKERETKDYGEYRTERLVLEAYDKLAKSDRFREEMPKRTSAFVVPNKRLSATSEN